MASVSVTQIWTRGITSVFEHAETIETSEDNLQIQNLLQMTTRMLIACPPKVDGIQPQSMQSDKRAALIDNVAAEYLKFRLDPTLREDDAMLSCSVV